MERKHSWTFFEALRHEFVYRCIFCGLPIIFKNDIKNIKDDLVYYDINYPCELYAMKKALE